MGRKMRGPDLLLTISIFSILIIINSTFVIGYVVLNKEDDDDNPHQHTHPRVRSMPEVIIAEGEIGMGGNISVIHLYIQLYGNNGIDMRDVVIHVICISSDSHSSSTDFLLEVVDDPGDPGFIVEEVYDPLGAWDPEGTPSSFILGQRAQLKLTFNIEEDLVTLPPDSIIEITFDVTSTGFETIEILRTPSSYPSAGTIKLED